MINKIKKSSDLELINIYNKEVWSSASWIARMSFLSAIHSEFIKRWFDYSTIWNEKWLSFKNKIKINDIDWKKIITIDDISDKISFNSNDINKSIQNVVEIWTKENKSITKLLLWQNPDWKNYISLLFWKWLHLDKNSIINSKKLNYPIWWTIRWLWRNKWVIEEKLLYNFKLDDFNIELINASPLDKNIKKISKWLIEWLRKFENKWVQEISIILFNFKWIADLGIEHQKKYFQAILEVLDMFLSKNTNIEKIYLS